jgi:hypothetical protein
MSGFRVILCLIVMANAGWGEGCGDDPPALDAGPIPEDGPGPQDRIPPRIVATEPVDDAVDVAPESGITVRFDEAIAVTEPEAALRLFDESGEAVPGTVEVEEAVLRFVPVDDLALLGRYVAVVTPAVMDMAGNPLEREHRFELSIGDGGWDEQGTLLEHDDAGDALTPEVAMNARGDVVAVWSQYGPPYNIRAARYDAAAEVWESARLLEHDDTGDATLPRVAMDAAGNAIAVWQHFDGTSHHVWASRYQASSDEWEEPAQLDVCQTGEAGEPRIAMNAAGEAMVVWRQSDDTVAQPWSRRFDAQAGWEPAEQVQVFGDPAQLLGYAPEVAIDNAGNAMITFLDGGFHLQAVPHLAATGWGTAEELAYGPVENFDVALDGAGRGFVAWEIVQPSRINAWHQDPATGSTTDLLMVAEEDERGSLAFHDVAASAGGDGIALWMQESPSPKQVWAGVYSLASRSWSAPIAMHPANEIEPYVSGAQVAMDPRGHAHAIWTSFDDADHWLTAARRRASGEVEVLGRYVDIGHARLAVNAQGKAVIVRTHITYAGGEPRRDVEALLFR